MSLIPSPLDKARTCPATHSGLTSLVGTVRPQDVEEALEKREIRAACVLMAARAHPQLEWIVQVIPHLDDTRWIPWLVGQGPESIEDALPALLQTSAEAQALLLLSSQLRFGRCPEAAAKALAGQDLDYYTGVLVGHLPIPSRYQDSAQDALGQKVLEGVKRLVAGDLSVLFPPARTPVLPRVSTGRNDPCPCGSGQKFKKCCGR